MGAGVLLAITAATKVAQVSSGISAAHKKEDAIDMQADENVIQNQQRQMQNYSQASKLLGMQEVQAVGKGVSMSSSSFNAIQRQSLNTTAKKASNLNIERNLIMQNAQNERDQVHKSIDAMLFGVAGQRIAIWQIFHNFKTTTHLWV